MRCRCARRLSSSCCCCSPVSAMASRQRRQRAESSVLPTAGRVGGGAGREDEPAFGTERTWQGGPFSTPAVPQLTPLCWLPENAPGRRPSSTRPPLTPREGGGVAGDELHHLHASGAQCRLAQLAAAPHKLAQLDRHLTAQRLGCRGKGARGRGVGSAYAASRQQRPWQPW